MKVISVQVKTKMRILAIINFKEKLASGNKENVGFPLDFSLSFLQITGFEFRFQNRHPQSNKAKSQNLQINKLTTFLTY